MGADYDALSFAQTAEMYMVAGVVGTLVHLLVLLSYFFVPNIKAQHPAADVVVWQVACELMLSLGFVVAYVIEGVVRACVCAIVLCGLRLTNAIVTISIILWM